MRKILIHIPVEPFGEYDIFTQHNNSSFVDVIKNRNGGICPNVGNRLWFQGVVSAITCEDNLIDYWAPTMSKDFINEMYDLIVAPMANVFSTHFITLLETLAERFCGIKIPVYVIACGIQALNYDSIDEICCILKKPASKFISSVYDTGGEFALRGYFTKEFFDRLGFSSAVVTGCPSLYQLGSSLEISGDKVERDKFKPLFNGVPGNYKRYMNEYLDSVFLDQDVFWKEVIDPNFCAYDQETKCILEALIRKWGFDTTKLLLESRIHLFPDMNCWREFIRDNHFSCSFGSRIHGSIMPILAGIPAILECRDARTREMAEFFDIPFVFPNAEIESLYDLYTEIDYSCFNKNFVKHYNYYESFLQKCGIVDQVNTQNNFFHKIEKPDYSQPELEHKTELLHTLMSQHRYWMGYSKFLSIKRSIFSRLRD